MKTNKIIADFDDRKYKPYLGNSSFDIEFNTYDECKEWINKEGYLKKRGYKPELGWELKFGNYHKSWEWLMPIIEKIELTSKFEIQSTYDDREEFIGWVPMIFTLSPKDDIKGLSLDTLRFKSKIEAMYKGVFEYIKWYNTKITS